MGEVAWIKVVGEGDADEELSAVYDECFNQKTGGGWRTSTKFTACIRSPCSTMPTSFAH